MAPDGARFGGSVDSQETDASFPGEIFVMSLSFFGNPISGQYELMSSRIAANH
jgi:hypothetical protein